MTKNLPAPSTLPLPPVPGDYHHLETVVVVNYPISEARTYLNRNIGNLVSFRLVECRRGERIGCARAVQVNPAGGGEPILIEAVRSLPDGTPAGPYAPEGLVERRARVVTSDGRPPKALDPRDVVVIHVPVKSYLRFLPGVYQGASATTQRSTAAQIETASEREWGLTTTPSRPVVPATATDALRRFLLLFQHMMTTVVDRVEAMPSLTDPLTCDPRFLPWIASWVQFSLDESLPLHQQRELVRRAIRLYRTRATTAGVQEMIRVLTGTEVKIQDRTLPQPFVLGGSTLAGKAHVWDRYTNKEPPGCFLMTERRAKILFFRLQLPHRTNLESNHPQRVPMLLQRIVSIVTAEKPAHLCFTIVIEED